MHHSLSANRFRWRLVCAAALAGACGSNAVGSGSTAPSGSTGASATGGAGAGSTGSSGGPATGSATGTATGTSSSSGASTGAATGSSATGTAGTATGSSSGAAAGAGSGSTTGQAGAAGSATSGSHPDASTGMTGSTSSGTSGASGSGTSGVSGTSGTSGTSGSATGDAGSTAKEGPCDIFKAGGTPCAAAYSTVRALSASYSGPLYQVRRADNTTLDIASTTAGGAADSAAQDTFCMGTSCTISVLYDQTTNKNDLTKAPGGSATYGPNADEEAVANALPTTLAGHRVYGVHVTPAASWTSTGQVGYRNTHTTGIAKNDDPETEYMVTDGTYFNGECCFDFGNAEMNPVAGGPGTMEAIYFGNCNWWDKGGDNGPWIMADLEVGVFDQGGASGVTNANDKGLAFPFVTAMVKGNSASATTGGPFTIKGGNAQSGTLSTFWDGARPSGYSPMHKLGGIVLGVGGDNSSTARGNFYEGILTTGYATTTTDDAVQQNIVAAGYGK